MRFSPFPRTVILIPRTVIPIAIFLDDNHTFATTINLTGLTKLTRLTSPSIFRDGTMHKIL